MSALQSRPAIQVAPVVFVTQTLVPVVLAPLLLGERFSDTPLGGIPLALSLAVLLGGRGDAGALAVAARADGRGAREPAQRHRAQPLGFERARPSVRGRPGTRPSRPSSTTTTSPARS